MQGSGSFGLEAVVDFRHAPAGQAPGPGQWGLRRADRQNGRHAVDRHTTLKYAESQSPAAGDVRAALAADPAITHVVVVHCETTSGILNPIEAIGAGGQGVRQDVHRRCHELLRRDPHRLARASASTSSFRRRTSASKACPASPFVICRRAALEATEGWARSWCFNLLDQWRYMEKSGLFRCTPPTHVVLAFAQALAELEAEGGVAARGGRYRANHQRLVCGMRRLGFREFLPPELQSPIITTFLAPPHPQFRFPPSSMTA